MATLLDWRIRLVVLGAIWGSSFLLIKIALADLTPLEITFGRCACGALALAPVVLATRAPLPRSWRLWAHLAVAALVLNTAPFTLFGYAEQHVSSAVAGVANGTTPLFTLLFAMLALSDERPTRRKLAGLALGLAGVAVVLRVWDGAQADTVGVLMAVAAAACYGLGWVYLRRFVRGSGYAPATLSVCQLACASVQLAVLCLLTGLLTGEGVPTPGVGTVAAVLGLGAVGTGLAYVLQHGILAEAGATASSTVTYLVPVFAVLAGVVVLGEQLGWHVPAGAALTLAGAAIATRTRSRERHHPGRGVWFGSIHRGGTNQGRPSTIRMRQ